MAEDSSRILVAEVNSIGASISNSQPVLKLRTLLVAVAGLSRLGSVAGGTERIINDSIEEISAHFLQEQDAIPHIESSTRAYERGL
ncbi:hypothetical protein QBC46DRAFT_85201 [Diplogelasinospora grovesii]|uniref:Uncharacterized protein n=1 Tax=Diplogelasinospora grovesii TaxID=303347 RepID=A0AAN6S5P7_9PEZI|nr:hypothetical protein QBC46DRAFT_85201 [Diplogelasinospora grovesii]